MLVKKFKIYRNLLILTCYEHTLLALVKLMSFYVEKMNIRITNLDINGLMLMSFCTFKKYSGQLSKSQTKILNFIKNI